MRGTITQNLSKKLNGDARERQVADLGLWGELTLLQGHRLLTQTCALLLSPHTDEPLAFHPQH